MELHNGIKLQLPNGRTADNRCPQRQVQSLPERVVADDALVSHGGIVIG